MSIDILWRFPMNKTELVKKVASETEMTQKQAAAALESVLGAIQDAVAAGDSVSLIGFGTFSLRCREAREGRNPATGKTMTFAASKIPVFKAGKAFKEKVNE
jgi:DNA-binding protein HU-beta